MLRSTTTPGVRRVNVSMSVRIRNRRPSLVVSETKSIAHRSFGRSTGGGASRFDAARRLRRLMRSESPSAR